MTRLCAGDTYQQIALQTNRSERSVRSLAYGARDRLGAKTVSHACAMLAANGREDDFVLTPAMRGYLKRFERRMRSEPVPPLLLEDLAL